MERADRLTLLEARRMILGEWGSGAGGRGDVAGCEGRRGVGTVGVAGAEETRGEEGLWEGGRAMWVGGSRCGACPLGSRLGFRSIAAACLVLCDRV